jgi:hypothetical protein
MALRAKNRSDEAEDDGFGNPKARMTTKYERFFAATRRDGANFLHLFVARRFSRLTTARSSLLDLEKIGSRRRHPR